MSWHQLEFSLRGNDLRTVEALLELAGAAAITLNDAGHDAIVEPDPGSTPVWTTVNLRALFETDAEARAAARLLPPELIFEGSTRVERLDDDTWQGNLSQAASMRQVGERLSLVDAADSRQFPGRSTVRISRGLAFGTGDHPTTLLCLEWLERHIASSLTFMDYGCGSGILAVAALRLGATAAWAVDIEPQALTATRRNAELNSVETSLWTGEPESLPDVSVDVLAANILARPLCDLAPRFHKLVAPGGRLLLSGILSEQCQTVREAYTPYFGAFTEFQRVGWVAISASRL